MDRDDPIDLTARRSQRPCPDDLTLDHALRRADPVLRATPDPAGDTVTLERVRTLVDAQRQQAQGYGTDPATARRLGARPVPSPRRRYGPLVAVAAATALAVAGGATVVATSHRGPRGGGHDAARAISGTVVVHPASATRATVVLDRIATVAAEQPVLAPSRDQYVYVRSEVGFAEETREKSFDGPYRLKAVHERQVWLSQDPARTGLIREGGQDTTLHGAADDTTLYAAMSTLPTDPSALLDVARRATVGDAGSPEAAQFDWIGEELKESVAPPAVTAALYRAAALVPGVVVVPDVVDAAGRHGTGIALEADGQRHEWIFDSSTSSFLGERDYLTVTSSLGPAGTLTGISAVLQRGVVDHPGDLPAPGAAGD